MPVAASGLSVEVALPPGWAPRDVEHLLAPLGAGRAAVSPASRRRRAGSPPSVRVTFASAEAACDAARLLRQPLLARQSPARGSPGRLPACVPRSPLQGCEGGSRSASGAGTAREWREGDAVILAPSASGSPMRSWQQGGGALRPGEVGEVVAVETEDPAERSAVLVSCPNGSTGRYDPEELRAASPMLLPSAAAPPPLHAPPHVWGGPATASTSQSRSPSPRRGTAPPAPSSAFRPSGGWEGVGPLGVERSVIGCSMPSSSHRSPPRNSPLRIVRLRRRGPQPASVLPAPPPAGGQQQLARWELPTARVATALLACHRGTLRTLAGLHAELLAAFPPDGAAPGGSAAERAAMLVLRLEAMELAWRLEAKSAEAERVRVDLCEARARAAILASQAARGSAAPSPTLQTSPAARPAALQPPESPLAQGAPVTGTELIAAAVEAGLWSEQADKSGKPYYKNRSDTLTREKSMRPKALEKHLRDHAAQIPLSVVTTCAPAGASFAATASSPSLAPAAPVDDAASRLSSELQSVRAELAAAVSAHEAESLRLQSASQEQGAAAEAARQRCEQLAAELAAARDRLEASEGQREHTASELASVRDELAQASQQSRAPPQPPPPAAAPPPPAAVPPPSGAELVAAAVAAGMWAEMTDKSGKPYYKNRADSRTKEKSLRPKALEKHLRDHHAADAQEPPSPLSPTTPAPGSEPPAEGSAGPASAAAQARRLSAERDELAAALAAERGSIDEARAAVRAAETRAAQLEEEAEALRAEAARAVELEREVAGLREEAAERAGAEEEGAARAAALADEIAEAERGRAELALLADTAQAEAQRLSAELEQGAGRVREAEEELREAQEEAAAARAERDRLARTAESLGAEAAMWRDEASSRGRAAEDLGTVERDRERVLQALRDTERRAGECEHRAAQAREEAASLRQRLRDSREQQEQLQQDAATLRSSADWLRRELDAAQKEACAQREAAEQQQQRAQHFAEQADCSSAEAGRLQAALAAARQELEQLQARPALASAEERAKGAAEAARLLQQKGEEVLQLHQAVRARDEELISLREELRLSRGDTAEAAARCDSTTSLLRAELAAMAMRVEVAEAAEEEARQRDAAIVAARKDEVRQLLAELAAAQDQAEQHRRTAAAAERRLLLRQGKLQGLGGQLAETQVRATKAEGEAAHAHTEYLSLRRRLAEAEEAAGEEAAGRRRSDEELQELRQATSERSAKEAALEQELEALREEAAVRSEEREELQGRLRALEAEAAARGKGLQGAQQREAAAVERAAVAAAELRAAEQECEKLRVELRRAAEVLSAGATDGACSAEEAAQLRQGTACELLRGDAEAAGEARERLAGENAELRERLERHEDGEAPENMLNSLQRMVQAQLRAAEQQRCTAEHQKSLRELERAIAAQIQRCRAALTREDEDGARRRAVAAAAAEGGEPFRPRHAPPLPPSAGRPPALSAAARDAQLMAEADLEAHRIGIEARAQLQLHRGGGELHDDRSWVASIRHRVSEVPTAQG
eukprot:TRINITY_DN28688_c0_g2_i4.p1 TRINITY_DN28688_c0_g2~~TRINITY_DN28688_c0_g2_i4.p1  ORF type:complete len:1548 (+),score=592.18 TRINITY_DN28688_c0_g2_i4:77-4645(+)